MVIEQLHKDVTECKEQIETATKEEGENKDIKNELQMLKTHNEDLE